MKIQLLLMIKNAEESILNTLISYEGKVDIIKVYDTGSSDRTIEIIKNYKNICRSKIYLNFIPFENFSQARNLCFEMAYDLRYEWTIFADDSYELIGNIKEELEFIAKFKEINCIGVRILRDSIDYISKRITRTSAKLKYFGAVHEDIDLDINYVSKKFYLYDRVYPGHTIRTSQRLFSDIKMIKGKTDSRSLFFKANMTFQLFHRGLCDPHTVLNCCYDRLLLKELCFCEDNFAMFMTAGLMCNILEYKDESVKNYLAAALTCPGKSGEPFFYIYLNTGVVHYLKKAYENKILGPHILPTTSSVYSDGTYIGHIEQEYNRYFSLSEDYQIV